MSLDGLPEIWCRDEELWLSQGHWSVYYGELRTALVSLASLFGGITGHLWTYM